MRALLRRSAVLWLLLLCFGFVASASAHANLVRSDPAANSVLQTAPEQLQLWFSEPLEAGFSEVQVLDSARRRVDHGDGRPVAGDPAAMVVSLQALEQGTYTVAWRALSAVDGHVTRGSFSFSVGVAGAPVPAALPEEVGPGMPVEAVTRWLTYLAGSALLGALLFRLLVLLPVARRLELVAIVEQALARPLKLLLRISWAVLLLGMFAALLLQAVLLADSGLSSALQADVLQRLLFGTRYGVIWLARLVLLLGLAVVLGWRRLGDGEWRWYAGLLLAAAALLTISLNSHSAAVANLTALAVLADWLHLLAVALWVGGLLSMVLLLPVVLRALEPAARWRLLAHSIPRFSALAGVSVATLALTGLYQAWLHVGSFAALRETLYGGSLLLKLLAVVPLLALGAVNLLVIRPRLGTAASSAGQGERAGKLAGYLSRLVRAETALALLVLLITAVLTSLPPGRQTYQQIQAARPLVMRAQAADLQLSLELVPARPGPNTMLLRLENATGAPVADAERVSLTFSYLDEALGSSSEVAQPRGDGSYSLQSGALGLEGRWQVELLVRRAGMPDARTAFRFLLTPTAAVEERPASASSTGPLLPRLSRPLALALGLILLGLGLAVYIGRTLGLRQLEGQVLASASLVVIGLGFFLLVRAPRAPIGAASDTPRVNPFPPTQSSLATGEQIYRARCQACHGASGRGDGPAAAVLNPRPADLREHMSAGHSDGEIFGWISTGVPGTAMPAFQGQLSEEELWHVINFIRTFASAEGGD